MPVTKAKTSKKVTRVYNVQRDFCTCQEAQYSLVAFTRRKKKLQMGECWGCKCQQIEEETSPKEGIFTGCYNAVQGMLGIKLKPGEPRRIRITMELI